MSCLSWFRAIRKQPANPLPAAAPTPAQKPAQTQPYTASKMTATPPPIPESQRVLLLHAPKQPYHVTHDYAVPTFIHDRELLVQTRAISLNPIDWKSADFNFAIPELPYISGRELAGDVVRLNTGASRLQTGDRVLAISTDYRDLRKGAYQEYVVAWDFNTVRLPPHISYEAGATIGVAFVAAILALGVNLGVDFTDVEGGPDLLHLVRTLPSPETLLPADIRDECLSGISETERAQPGDWIAVWGASSTSAHLAIQLARLAGLKVAAIVDKAKHGLRLVGHDAAVCRPDLVIDSHDPARAVSILRANLGRKLRFGFDTRGRDTSTWLLKALACSPDTASASASASSSSTAAARPPSPPTTPRSEPDKTQFQSHLVGLTGLPKGAPPEGGVYHNVPIKLFHEIPDIGEALCAWLERLLAAGRIVPPAIAGVDEGLGSINASLDRMRAGEISGGRLVIRLGDEA